MTEPAPHTFADLSLIKRIIPHRYPFLLVDKVRDIVPFESAVGIKNVTCNEPHFQGHFPDEPVMPGVTIVEAMAQTAAIVVGISLNVIDKPLATYFMGIDGVKFRKPVEPGHLLDLHVSILQAKRNICKFEGRALLDGQLATECQFTAMIADPPSD